MNKLLLLFVAALLLPSFSALANKEVKPEPVYSFVKQLRPIDWYHDQAEAWRKVIDRDPANADAWWNYFSACRISVKLAPDNKKPAFVPEREAFLADMKKAIPNTFEYHLILHTALELTEQEQAEEHLSKAFEIDPERPETYSDLFLKHELKLERQEAARYAKLWFESNDLSPGLLAWNYNVLMSLDQNAVIITNGDNDTFPLWVLQHARNLRPDVTVINVSLAHWHTEYGSALLQAAGVLVGDLYENSDALDASGFGKRLVTHLSRSCDRPFYLSIGSLPEHRELLDDDLYLTGMAFKYSPSRFDNVAIIKRNYEKRFMLDYINLPLQADISQGIVDRNNISYLPSMLILLEHYDCAEEQTKASNLRNLIRKIAEAGGCADQLKSVLEG